VSRSGRSSDECRSGLQRVSSPSSEDCSESLNHFLFFVLMSIVRKIIIDLCISSDC